MGAFQLKDINFKTVLDPRAFVEECDVAYQERVDKAAEKIAENVRRSPVVLLAGPSGSGKTTTSMKISEALERRGIGSHYIAMDDYFLPVDPETSPRTPEGDFDFESPLCLDMELLNRHFSQLAAGESIVVPRYDFKTKARAEEASKTVTAGKDEVVVFEGIHALNSIITDRHPEAFKLYIAAMSDIVLGDQVVFKRTWIRLVRRMVRDFNFRGTDPMETMSMWANVRRGEKMHITPFKNKADFQFDTSHAYELPVFNTVATQLLQTVPEGIERFEELRAVLPAVQLFGHIDLDLVPKTSMIREFTGGAAWEE